MSQIDLKALLSQLDSTCVAYLEKASQFCLREGHVEVGVEHYVLQMLDDSQNDLNQLLQRNSIQAIEWIKILLGQTSRLSSKKGVNPVFSKDLINWLEKALSKSNHTDSAKIHVRELVLSVLQHSRLAKLLVVDGNSLSAQQVDDYFQSSTAVLDEEIIDISSADSDGTVIISEAEIKQSPAFKASAIDYNDLDIAGYGDQEKIGEGGMAVVYRANHLGLDREVALKVLKPNTTADDDFIARFLREARIVAKLAHPNIIQIYDINHVDEFTYLAMEFISGGELSDKMDAGFDLSETLRILSQVLAALQSAHDKGYIHRDIKPANILFRDDGSVVLTDFGIARAMNEDNGLTIAGSILGTPRYMSPEQAKGESVDHRSDLYSVGVLFYQMLEKKLPYLAESAIATAMKHILEPVPKLSEQWQQHQHFIDRAMAKDMTNRFQSGDEMIEALKLLN